MILDNLTRAFKTQNWLAAGVEFFIVIAGVVIGFQINAWAERLNEQSRAQIMQARLADDLRAEQWRIAALRAYAADVISEAQSALNDIERSRQMPQLRNRNLPGPNISDGALRLDLEPPGSADRLSDEELVIKAFRGTQYFWSGIIWTTYDELVAGGELHLIGGGAFSDIAVEYYNSSSSNLLSESNNTPFRDAFRQRVSPELHRALVANCAEDPNVAIGDFEALENYLAFPCEVDGFGEDIARMARQLREDETLAQLLRWRIIESDQNQSSTAYFADLLQRAIADYETR